MDIWRISLLLVTLSVVVYFVEADFPQIHRALPSTNGKPGYRVLSSGVTVDKRDKGKHVSATDNAAKFGSHHSIMSVGSSWSTAACYSIISSILVGLSGIFPLLVIPLEAGPSLKHGAGSVLLKLLLSFAVGSMLGDVFLHLLPEAWATVGSAPDPHQAHTTIGLWIIFGLLSFMVIEKVFAEPEEEEESEQTDSVHEAMEVEMKKMVEQSMNKNGTVPSHLLSNGYNLRSRQIQSMNHESTDGINGSTGPNTPSSGKDSAAAQRIQVSGYLNLVANCIDNFTHGLAVAGSYLISPKVGLCTTIAILLHEIPHEVGDFAILLRSGFDRWKAAKAQVLTASGGVLGALFALFSTSAESAGDRTSAILPFTAGGFIYIALVSVVPDLLKETCPKESLKQMLCLLAGVLSMLVVTLMFE